MTTRPDLDTLIAASIAIFNQMSPEQQELLMEEQRKGVEQAQVRDAERRRLEANPCLDIDLSPAKPDWVDRAAWVAEQLLGCFPRDPELQPERADPEDPGQSLDHPHLLWMALELRDRKLDSETKACRWLGWLQAGMVSHRLLSLAGMKELNLRSATEARVTRRAPADFQARCQAWLNHVTAGDATDLAERRARFAEEAMEWVQSIGATADEMHQLVDYVFGRPAGDPPQEIGGMLTTAAVLAEFTGQDLMGCGERELARCWDPKVIEKIRGKRSRRHGRGPLPGTSEPEADLVPAKPHRPAFIGLPLSDGTMI